VALPKALLGIDYDIRWQPSVYAKRWQWFVGRGWHGTEKTADGGQQGAEQPDPCWAMVPC
jgi:hypothetical protein